MRERRVSFLREERIQELQTAVNKIFEKYPPAGAR
jgi:hypothetical protein